MAGRFDAQAEPQGHSVLDGGDCGSGGVVYRLLVYHHPGHGGDGTDWRVSRAFSAGGDLCVCRVPLRGLDSDSPGRVR